MKSCFTPYMTSYDSLYNRNAIALLVYCSLLIFHHFLGVIKTGESAVKITRFLKNEVDYRT